MNMHLLSLDKISFYGIDIIDPNSFIELIVRFSFNTLVLYLLVGWLYYSITRRKDYLFTYILIGSIVFLLCYLLGNVKLQIGFALGLFAIFGIIRYRTDLMPIKEMTYLFLVIALSVINALVSNSTGVAEILFTNFIILLITYGFEKLWLLKHESVKEIIYEKIELIKPDTYQEMLSDLQCRTGLKINRFEIGRIDFLKDIARINIYYYSDENRINLTDSGYNKNGDSDDDD
jgi:hypothetical protein